MASRSPARFLAPLALVAFAFALFLIVTAPSSDEEDAAPNRTTEESPEATPTAAERREERRERRRRTYTVKPGDTPSAIAEDTGVPLEELLELNPDLDPQTLAPGQRLKLRE
jgi:hypothetical protein